MSNYAIFPGTLYSLIEEWENPTLDHPFHGNILEN